ncbi:MAG TPA: hypothetical protein VH599_16010 [Ktedonobacterales bacterium]|jgi:hypothetical protein
MNRIASVMTMYSRDRFSWFLLPWIIVGSSFAINVFIALLLGGKTPIYTGGLSSIYVFMMVVGAITVAGTFPFAVGFGVRRKDYFLGTIAMAVATSAAWAILIWLLSLIEGNLIPNWGVDLHFFHLPYVSDGPLYAQLWTFFAVMVLMYFLGFLPASVYQRFGRTGMYTLFGLSGLLLSVLSLVNTYWNWWGPILDWFGQQSAAMLGLWTVPVIAVCILASYALLRKATI